MRDKIFTAGRYIEQSAVQHACVGHHIMLQEDILQLVEFGHNRFVLRSEVRYSETTGGLATQQLLDIWKHYPVLVIHVAVYLIGIFIKEPYYMDSDIVEPLLMDRAYQSFADIRQSEIQYIGMRLPQI